MHCYQHKICISETADYYMEERERLLERDRRRETVRDTDGMRETDRLTGRKRERRGRCDTFIHTRIMLSLILFFTYCKSSYIFYIHKQCKWNQADACVKKTTIQNQ